MSRHGYLTVCLVSAALLSAVILSALAPGAGLEVIQAPGQPPSAAAADSSAIQLSHRCPPGFEKTPAERCELRTLYQFYGSLQNRGVGGTRTALPAHRDGFSPEEIDLGRYLFFDPLLSVDGSQSCASCHDPALGFGDGRARSVGVAGREVHRSAPTLWNVAFLDRFFWDARATSLEEQAPGPLFAPDEMANNPEQLHRDLNASEHYRRLFREAFPGAFEDGRSEIQLAHVYHALAAFQTTLISLNSRYDRYAHGDHDALSEAEIAGLNVFRSFVARCAECHTPPLFTNQQVAVIGTPEPEGLPLDTGAEQVFGSPKMKAGFKVPTLRNIARTAPYMHSGRYQTLREAVAFYSGGRGHAVPEGVDLHIHWHIWEPDLTDAEMDRVVDFLGTLSDERFLPEIPTAVPSGLTPVIGVAVEDGRDRPRMTEIEKTKKPEGERS